MGPDLGPIPLWPDFCVVPDEKNRWTAYTNTGRPGTPIFARWLGRHPNARSAKEHASALLDEAFKEAHPNGCPGSH